MARAILWVTAANSEQTCVVQIKNYICDDFDLVPDVAPGDSRRLRAWFDWGWRIEPGGPSTTECGVTTILLHHE